MYVKLVAGCLDKNRKKFIINYEAEIIQENE